MKVFHPMRLFAATLLAAGLACSAFGGGRDVPPTQTSTAPTATPAFTESAATLVPTPTKEPAFFIEEFDPGFAGNNWQRFTLGKGTTENLLIQQQDDHLLFDLGNEDIYVYYMYTPYTYGNVAITVSAENRGRNNNTVSLICRMNYDASMWYEFSVTSSGLWSLYAVDNIYHLIDSGGANALKQGQAVNEYGMVCNDDEITLAVNGQEIKTIKETKYGFKNGFVGFNISSIKGYSILPITVAVNWFEIAETK